MRVRLDRRFAQQLTAAARLVGLSDHAADGVTGFEESVKRRQRERCASQEDELYSHFPWRISFLMRRLIMSRLMKLMWYMKNLPFR